MRQKTYYIGIWIPWRMITSLLPVSYCPLLQSQLLTGLDIISSQGLCTGEHWGTGENSDSIKEHSLLQKGHWGRRNKLIWVTKKKATSTPISAVEDKNKPQNALVTKTRFLFWYADEPSKENWRDHLSSPDTIVSLKAGKGVFSWMCKVERLTLREVVY